MKKIIVLLSVLSVFTGCSLSETFKDDPEFTAMEGILTSQKENDEYPGTHLLTDVKGEVTAIRSLSINLDSREYLGNEVEALGVLNSSDNVFEVTGLTVIDVLSQVTLERQLTMYENFELGFRLDFYNDWTVEEKEFEVNFLAPVAEGANDRTFVKITQEQYAYVVKATDEGVTDTPLVAYFRDKEGRDVSTEINKVGVDGIDAVKSEVGGTIVYTLYRPGLIYEIVYTPATVTAEEDKNVFQEMLTSFQFVGFEVSEEQTGGEEAVEEVEEVTPIVDTQFTSFESLPYSFAGKYPKSWYYAGKKGDGQSMLHHYGFSDESVTDTNELIALDVLPSPSQAGEKKTVDGKELYIQTSSNQYTVNLTVNGQHYRIQGGVSYKDLILAMANGITPIKEAGENL